MILRLLSFAATSLTCLAQTTWTVSQALGSQFTTVQAAIAAATPGDRVEVLGAGPYPAFIVDKGVDVESIHGAACPYLEVVAVPNGQTARVAGFVNSAASVRDCLGAVLLVNLGQSGRLDILNSGNVFVRGGTFRGDDGWGWAFPGVIISGSQAVLVGATARGGNGLYVSSIGGSGGTGIVVGNGSHVTLVGVAATGGAATTSGPPSGSGGHGIDAAGGSARVLGACILQGGAGFPFGSPGLAAHGNVHYTPDTVLIGGTWAATAIVARPIVTAPGTVLVGTTLVVGVQGSPNQFVLLGLDLQCGYTQVPALASVLSLTPTMVLAPVITLDALGAGSLLLPIPNHPAAQNRNVFAQAGAFVGGSLVLSAPTSSRTQ